MTTSHLEIRSLLFYLFFLVLVTGFGQNQTADSLTLLLENTEVGGEERAKLNLQLSKVYERLDIGKSRQFAANALAYNNDSIRSEARNQLGRAYFYLNKLDSASYHFKKSIDLLKALDLEDKAASVSISLGAVQLRKGDYKGAVSTLLEGATFFENTKDSVNMAKCYSNVSSAFGELADTEKAIHYGEKALHIFEAKNMEPYKAITLPNLAGQLLKMGDTIQATTYFLEAERLAKKRNDKFSLARIYNNLGGMYLESNLGLAEDYLSQALEIRKETKNNDGIGTLYNNLGYLYLQQGDSRKAIPHLKNALEFGKGVNEITTLNNLSNAYRNLGDHKRALEYSDVKNAINDSILKVDNQKAIFEISAKYETEKQEKEILNLKNINLETDIKRKQNANLMYISLGLLVMGIILAYSRIKYARKKRIIAEQQQELEMQKVEKLLKEQELIGLDAMIEGQEKERQRIAEDLHDSLGGKLSTLKLFVENVKKVDEGLYEKIKAILDESYDDVRNISHQKNATAMIDKGLIPAVNIVANRLKSSEKLHVEVVNIDLKKNVKNFIELQLFRVIQELLTNTVKHAQARHVNIQFSEENGTLNVVYEDDGVGYDAKAKTVGVGLKNIASRVKKMGGSFTVDSNPGNGTTVILNVPI